MDTWWGHERHVNYEKQVLAQIKHVYGPRFSCSNRNVLWLLQHDPTYEPCQPYLTFRWLSRWGEPAQIQVKVNCTCGEVFQQFFANLDDRGQVTGDTLAPWLLPAAA